MSITMKKIAEGLNISRTCVSTVLNNRPQPHVAPETRRRILELANQYNYRPNRAAQLLCGKSARIIGVLRFGYELYRYATEYLTELLNNNNYSVYYANICTAERERKVIEELIDKGADGFILFHNRSRQKYDTYTKPEVVISDYHENYDITIDLELGGYMATMHLLEHGHRDILTITPYVAPQESSGAASFSKYAGYRRALEGKGLPVRPPLLVNNTVECAELLLNQIRLKKVTALVCSNDELAGRAINFLAMNGINVPADVAVTGFDHSKFADFFMPGLCTVAQPVMQAAELATKILLEKLASNNLAVVDNPVILPTELIPNRSCGCPPCSLSPFDIYPKKTL